MLLFSCERIFILRNELSEKVNISFNRNSLEKLKSKSDQEINNGNYRLAIETNIMIRDLLKKMKDSSESVIFTTREISDLYLKTGQITKAENELTIALKENPNNYYLLYGILNVLLDKKEYSALIDISNEIISNNPNDNDAIYYRAIAKGNLNKNKEALLDFIKVSENEEPSSETEYNIGKCYEKLNDHNRAIDSFNKAIKLNPNYVQAIVSKGNCLINLGNKEMACEEFHKALDLGDYKVKENIKENSYFIFTHKHPDHYSRKRLKKVIKSKGGEKFGSWDVETLLKLNGMIPDFKIEAFRTNHFLSRRHYSYLITWHNNRIFLSGDTTDPTVIKQMSDIDWSFIPAWLIKNIFDSEGQTDVMSKMFVIYHIGEKDKINIIGEKFLMLDNQGRLITVD